MNFPARFVTFRIQVGEFPDGIRNFQNMSGEFPNSIRNFKNISGEFPDSIRNFKNTIGEFPDSIHNFKNMSGEFPDGIRKFPNRVGEVFRPKTYFFNTKNAIIYSKTMFERGLKYQSDFTTEVYTAGSCWLRQWKLPKPQIKSVESIPTTFRVAKQLCKISKALSSFTASRKVGATTYSFEI